MPTVRLEPIDTKPELLQQFKTHFNLMTPQKVKIDENIF